MAAILALAILLFQEAVITHHGTPDPVTLAVTNNCAWISEGRTELVPVAKACEAAFQIRDSMPNFVCDLKVKRTQVVPVVSRGSTNLFRREDVVAAEVTYLNGQEQFGNVRINGIPTNDPNAAHTHNWTSGEFSPPALTVLAAQSVATFSFHDEKKVAHEPRLDFDYSVPQPNKSWRWTFFGRSYTPAFHGTLSVDQRTGFVRNFTMIADHVPTDVPYTRVEVSTDYDSVAIAGLGIYQLPVRAVITTCQRGFPDCDQNVKQFFGCRRFAAKARIVANP